MIVPSSPADKTAIRQAIEQMVDSLVRMDAEKDHIKEIQDMLKEKHDLKPATSKKMAVTHHKRSYADENQKNTEFEELYEAILENRIHGADNVDEVDEDTQDEPDTTDDADESDTSFASE